MRRGTFIVVEGPDGAGKTTLVRALSERLEAAGRAVTCVREPGGTPAAEAVRALVLHGAFEWTPQGELFLMLTARADLVVRVIRPALAAGAVVLSDRYELSTLAYQVAGRRLPRAAVTGANRLATGGLKADLTLVLDLPPAVGRRRQVADGKAPDRVEREDAAWHARVARAFRAARGRGMVHLDASRSPLAVLEAAWQHVGRMRTAKP
jgi:dTMP kinase